MSGLVEVARLKQRLDDTFDRIGGIDSDPELQSDFAKYLCVLVSGYIERAVVHIVQEHARREGGPTLQRFVEEYTKRGMNPNTGKIKDLLGRFNKQWTLAIKQNIVDEQETAVNSIVSQCNRIAHGDASDITYRRIRMYYEQALLVVDQVHKICLGENAT